MHRFLLVALAVFVFSARGYVQVADTCYSLQTAERIVSSGQLDIAHAEGATLRAPAERAIDLRNVETFQGLDVWPAHLWRYYNTR